MGIFGGFRKKENKEPEPAATRMKGKEYKIGDRIGGEYEICNILGGEGQSGMGVVYICLSHKDKMVLAFKTYQEKYLTVKEITDSFKREAMAWINIGRHPYIVKAQFVNEFDSRLFVVCEFVAPDGQGRNTLTHYLKGPVPLKQALSWSIQFCYGMEHSRSKGVTPHRDIKPDNLMVTSDGTLKVTDFGLAGLWENTNLSPEIVSQKEGDRRGLTFINLAGGNIVCGTPPYMAPEQFYGESDLRNDIYSFGIVMYQMVNRECHLNLMRLPFWPKSGDDWVTVHETYSVPEVDSKLYPIIEKCLRKKPEERYGGNDIETGFIELRKDLEQLYEDTTGELPPPLPDNKKLNALELHNKGLSLSSLGLVDDAIKEYRRALDIDPELDATHINLGNVLSDKGLIDEAIKEYQEALRINPSCAEAHNNLGRALSDKGLIDEAIKEYRKALEINPEYAHAHNNLGIALDKQGLIDDAIKEWRKALEINPKYANAHNNLGVALSDKGLIDDAIKEFGKALEINPEHANAHHSLGVALFDKGLIDDAIKEFGKALEINPEHANAHNNLGSALLNKGMIDDAIKEWKKALEINPEHASAYYNLGVALKNKGLWDEAILAYREAIKVNPEHANTYSNLGNVLQAKGLVDDAIKEYKKALEINPRLAEIHLNLGIALAKKGLADEAVKAYENFIKYAPPQYARHVEKVKNAINELKQQGG